MDDNRARGFFVSKNQGRINWEKVKLDGYSYVHIRATGTNDKGDKLEVDPLFLENWQGAGKAGLLRSIYHGLHPWLDGQAAFLCRSVGQYKPELGFYCDIEGAATWAKANLFLEAADMAFGETFGIYTSLSWLNRQKVDYSKWKARRLWLAAWTFAQNPTAPPGWAWEFWQYTDGQMGVVAGVSGAVCLDRFWGTDKDLHDVYTPWLQPDAPPLQQILLKLDRLQKSVDRLLESCDVT